jgi:cobalt transporter subunit CbtB
MSKAIARTAASESRAATHLPALALLLFGLVVLYGVGFSAIPAVHNAAHDVRHATGFPCH